MRAVAEECARIEPITHLTLHAFGYENWNRPKHEVNALMSLLDRFLLSERPTLIDNGIAFRAIGRLDRLPANVRAKLDETTRLCSQHENLTLCLALSYSGRQEIVGAARNLCRQAREGTLSPDGLDEAAFERCLDTADMPALDLLIRTGGDMRLSNFMLWQVAYAELYFTDVCWPDFGREEFHKALESYAGRERRYGRVGSAE
jgi:undecaprenyl diphosphate synthase